MPDEVIPPATAAALSDEKIAYLQRIELAVRNVANEVTEIRKRVEHVETRQGDIEDRAARNSGGVRELRAETSHHDLSQEAALAAEILARQDLAKKVDTLTDKTDAQTAILTRLDRLAQNPLVKWGVNIVLTALASYLATKGVHVQ